VLAKIIGDRFRDKKAEIGIIGLGYVGLPLALAFAEAGFQVTGFDVDKEKVMKLRKGRSYINSIPDGSFEKINPTSVLEDLHHCLALIICVPTPLTENKEPDLTYVRKAATLVNQLMHGGAHARLVSLESTTYPGTTEEIFLPLVLDGLTNKVGEDLFVVYSPEREDPGNKNFNLKNTPKVIGGITLACREVGTALYEHVCKLVPVESVQTAEMVKIFENTYRAVNIAFVNELKMLCFRLNINIWEVIKAAATKPFGFQPFWPGPGLGGPCIPVNPFYLTWRARQVDMRVKFVELADEVNSAMPKFVVERVAKGLPLHGSSILVVGVAYKADVADTRESPASKIIRLLKEEGAVVDYHDSLVPEFEGMQSVSLPDIQKYHSVLLVTVHSNFDVRSLAHARSVVDTRGVWFDAIQA